MQADFVAVLFVEAVPNVHFDRADRRLPVHARARANTQFEVVYEGVTAVHEGRHCPVGLEVVFVFEAAHAEIASADVVAFAVAGADVFEGVATDAAVAACEVAQAGRNAVKVVCPAGAEAGAGNETLFFADALQVARVDVALHKVGVREQGFAGGKQAEAELVAVFGVQAVFG